MSDEPDRSLPDLVARFAPWIAASIVLVAGGPSVYVLVPHYMGLTDPGALVGLAWGMVWLAVVPAVSFLVAHVIAGVGNAGTERSLGSGLNGPWSGSLMVLSGVVLPVMAMIVLVPGLASLGLREDPGFTLWHVLLIALIPIGILVSWEAVALGRVSQPLVVGQLMGAALGISATYALLALSVFESIAPVVFVDPRAVLILTPPLAFLCAIFVYRKLRVVGDEATLVKVNKLVILGFALSLAALFVPEAAPGIARDAIADATSTSSKERRAGVRLLRGIGLDETVLRYCYREVVPPLALSEFMPGHRAGRRARVQSNDARAVYYRATGKPFNTVPRPGQWGGLWLRWSDTDVAGEQVGAKADGLSLARSSIEGSLDAGYAVGYLEWTLAFANASTRFQEARALIELPPEAVVSRVTLFVDGKPREAVFNDRTLVRKAYQQAVSTLQDPLLVTQVAPDRVLVQCFPVPPGTAGDQLKILLGIALPLPTETGATRLVKLPRIVENNFTVAANHEFRLTSQQPVASCAVAAQQKPALAGMPLRIEGELTEDQLLASGKALEIKVMITEDRKGQRAGTPAKSTPRLEPAPSRLFVVIDGSRCMNDHLSALAKALKTVPPGVKTDVLFASDEITALSPDGEVPVELSLERALKDIPILPCRGGPDNTPALLMAWKKACAEKDAAVLWIHGPQPTLFDNPENMMASFRHEVRENRVPRLYEIEVEPGPNKLIESLASVSVGSVNRVRFQAVPRLRSLSDDLSHLFRRWTGQAAWSLPEFDGSRLGPQPVWAAQPKLASAMRSLRVRHQVFKLLDGGKRVQAGAVASEHRIVTPVSGAVVLDTRAGNLSPGLNSSDAGKLAEARLKQIVGPPLIAPAVDTGIFKPKPIDRPRVAIPPPVPVPKVETTYTRPPFTLPPERPRTTVSPPWSERGFRYNRAPQRASGLATYGPPESGDTGTQSDSAGSSGQGAAVQPTTLGRPHASASEKESEPSSNPSFSVAGSSSDVSSEGPPGRWIEDSGRRSSPVGMRGSSGASGGTAGSGITSRRPKLDDFGAGESGGYASRSPMLEGATTGTIGPNQGDATVIQGVNMSSSAKRESNPADELRVALFGGAPDSRVQEQKPSEHLSIMIWLLRGAIFCAVVALLGLMLLPFLKQKRKNP